MNNIEKLIVPLITVQLEKENWETIIRIIESSDIGDNLESKRERVEQVKQTIQAKLTHRLSFTPLVALSKEDWEIITKKIYRCCYKRNKEWSDWAGHIITKINEAISEAERITHVNELIERKKLVTRKIAEMSDDFKDVFVLQDLQNQLILEVNFYSKYEVSILMSLGSYLFEKERSELFLFACHALRQFYNIGHNMVGEAFAGLFLKSEATDQKLEVWDGIDWYMGRSLRYKAEDLLVESYRFKLKLKGFEKEEIEWKGLDAWVNYRCDTVVKTLDEDYFQKLPEIINYRGPGTKQYIMTWSLPVLKWSHPVLKWKESKRITLDWSYYDLHAVVAFYRILANRHWDDLDYRKKLKIVAMDCAMLYIGNKIPKDQAGVAEYILTKVDNLEKKH